MDYRFLAVAWKRFQCYCPRPSKPTPRDQVRRGQNPEHERKAVKIRILLTLLVCAGVWAGPRASEQPPADCRPNPLNIPGAPYPCIYPDNRVMFRVAAPDAQKVRVRLGQGLRHDQGSGRAVVRHDNAAGGGLPLLHAWRSTAPSSPIPQRGRSSARAGYNSAIEVPEPAADADYYSAEGRAARDGAPAVVPARR